MPYFPVGKLMRVLAVPAVEFDEVTIAVALEAVLNGLTAYCMYPANSILSASIRQGWISGPTRPTSSGIPERLW